MMPNAVDGPNGATDPGGLGGWMRYKTFPANTTTKTYFPEEGALFPYVKSTQIFVCPSDTVGQTSGNSYAANACAFQQGAGGFRPGKSLASFESTALWMMLGEENSGFSNTQSSTDDGYMTIGNRFTNRHLEGSDVLFLDGHVKWYRDEAIRSNNFFFGGQVEGTFTARPDRCPAP
jgi:prepilin-type processing-associated H-X9-DG protein